MTIPKEASQTHHLMFVFLSTWTWLVCLRIETYILYKLAVTHGKSVWTCVHVAKYGQMSPKTSPNKHCMQHIATCHEMPREFVHMLLSIILAGLKNCGVDGVKNLVDLALKNMWRTETWTVPIPLDEARKEYLPLSASQLQFLTMLNAGCSSQYTTSI